MPAWPVAFLEFFVVLAFGIGWCILELYCKRLDRRLEAEKREQVRARLSTPGGDT